jgi:DNA polymerase III delta prime subunit
MNFLAEEKSEPVANNHTLWCEKYRPNKLEDYVGNDTLKAKVKQYIETNDIPHLLLYGSAGTGKTTLAKLITNSIKCDMLYINASDENGIDTIRVKIKNFACNIGFNPLKVIILDEADYFTPAGQAGLRNVMETFSEHTRFILTCNYHERIIEPIVSRCQSFAITPPTKKDVAISLSNILKKENVKFDKDGVVLLVNTHYPDIRAVINTAQRNVIDGTLTLAREDVLEGDIKAKMIEMLKDSNKKQAFTNIRQLLADNSVKSFADFYTVLFEKVDEYAPDNVADVIIIIADGQFQDASVVDKEICFMATIIKLLRAIK